MLTVILIGAAYCYLISVGLLISQDKNFRILNTVLLFTTIGTILLFSFFIQNNIAKYPLMAAQPILMALAAPLSYRFCNNIMEINLPWRTIHILQPVATFLAILCGFLFLPGTLLLPLMQICYIASSSSLVAYQGTFLVRNFRLLFFSQNRPSVRILFGVTIAGFVSSSIILVAAVQKDIPMMRLASLLLTGSLVVFFSFVQRFPQLLNAIQADIRSYTQSRLRNLDLTALAEKLNVLMVAEKVYLDENLTLASLALKLGISSHQLSEYLNSHLHKSFNAYVVDFRIQEAKTRLKEHPQMTSLEICFRSGFRSKTAFNKTFREIEGKSPSDYRNQQAITT
jgi:AraC-like DNA-binding protein